MAPTTTVPAPDELKHGTAVNSYEFAPKGMVSTRRPLTWIFVFFFISGFCSILYELVWLRLAMANFVVTTALVSIVLSVFMAGLGLGSWVAGWLVHRYESRIRFPRLRLYALCELLIGVSAVTVPFQFASAHRLLQVMADRAPLSSGTYYLIAGALLTVTLVPWCACMGATIPLAMSALREFSRDDSHRSFSFLYLANVLGAVAGATIPLLLIELYGFHGTLRVGAVLNTVIATIAFLVAKPASGGSAGPAATVNTASATLERSKGILLLLFTTGLATMGVEVIWIRLFTPYVGPVVYSFAKILASYLLATFAGSQLYRRWSRQRTVESPLPWVSLILFGVLPLLTADSRLPLSADLRVFLGIAPFAGVIGFLTPMLIDRWSGGDPDRAGRAYAINVVGCIVGPLLAGFLLLPHLGERVSMVVLALPWFISLVFVGQRPRQMAGATGFVFAAIIVCLFTQDYETRFPGAIVMRDSTATVTAYGQGMQKSLLVNGYGMTTLTPVTKMMAHLTLAALPSAPRDVLVVCFGMGTTFRSVASWGVPVTAVELVPSVPKLFPFYHSDAASVLSAPQAKVVVDDGRRYLERTPEKYDAIVIDPPPPIESAGSSLLYSRDFYAIARQRLKPGGILEQWFFTGDKADIAAVTRAIQEEFPYVNAYTSTFGTEGIYFFASMNPIPNRTPQELLQRMPPKAVADMMEWGPSKTPLEQINAVISQPISLRHLCLLAPGTAALSDDKPINEYNQLRSWLKRD